MMHVFVLHFNGAFLPINLGVQGLQPGHAKDDIGVAMEIEGDEVEVVVVGLNMERGRGELTMGIAHGTISEFDR